MYILPDPKDISCFQAQPSTVYLVKEFDNIAVFPHESSGHSNRSLIDPSAVYEVSGEEFKANESTSAAAQQSAGSPFGAYTAHLPPRQPLHRRKSSSFRKTMALVITPLSPKFQQANNVKTFITCRVPSNHSSGSHSRGWPA